MAILFKTNRFNLSRVEKHFINACCFGEDLALWLRSRLTENQIETGHPCQEDWGWELPAILGVSSYYLCISGNAVLSDDDENEGEWRIIVQRRRTLWERAIGKGKITSDDAMVRSIEKILSLEPFIRDVHRDES